MPSEGALPYPAAVRGMNFYATDNILQAFLRHAAPDLLRRRHEELISFGEFCGTALDEQAEYSDRIYPPVRTDTIRSPASPGTRYGQVWQNRRYEDCHQELYRRGFIARAFDEKDHEPHLYAFIAQYLAAQADISIGCPFAMTHPVALVVDRYAPEPVREKFLIESIRSDGRTKTGGTWATEKHSGSDIGQTATKAVPQPDGTVRLYGQKWFASNARSGLVVATARPEGAPEGSKGLGLYLVPSHIGDNWTEPNNYEVTHLKDKIGTRGLATGEILLGGALAYGIAPPPDGLRVMMEALGCSRVHNAMASAGMMRRALLEALCWVASRETFGKKLVERPMIRKRLLQIAVQWTAGCALAFEAARSFDDALQDEKARIWARIVTALAKFKTAEQAVWCVQKALGLVGGNGYTEDYPIARQYRDVMVLPVWEGPEQIQALELMRMIAGKEPGDGIFLAKLEDIAGALPAGMAQEKHRLETLRAALKDALARLRANPEHAEFVADEFLRYMADILAYALLCHEAAWELNADQNRYKMLAADSYYDSAFTGKFSPVFESHPLFDFFDTAVRDGFVPL